MTRYWKTRALAWRTSRR